MQSAAWMESAFALNILQKLDHCLQLQTFFYTELQVVADFESKFISIDTGAYGKQSDGGIFSASSLYHFLEDSESTLNKPSGFGGSGTEMPIFILGDEACPLKAINEAFRENGSVM
jgi:hypothetical protein